MKIATLLLPGLLLLSLLAVAQTPTPVAANGQLKVVGRQLSNQSGKAIQLRGMSSHGLQWFDQCYSQSSVQALANSWGADVFRAAMYVDEGGYLSNKAGLTAKVDQLVDWTGQAGMYCIIDWHILNPGDPNIHLADAKVFFQAMAQKHAGKKHVIYELCNEPNGVDWNTVKSYAEQLIPIIRQYDSQAIILVGTPNYSGTPGDVRTNPLTGANAYNVLYTFHFYAGSHYSQSYIDDVLKTVPVFVSEWGTSNYSGDGGNDYTNAQNWMNLFAGQNSSGIKVSWCNWNFADKNESSSALNSGACSTGNWNNTSQSGTWVKDHILNPADDFGPAAPAVAITTPASATTVLPGSAIAIAATVSNTVATSVEFYSGTQLLGNDATAPYTWTIANAPVGTYSLTAKALLGSGGPLTSPAVVVTVAPAPNQPPTVMLTNPSSNTTLTAPATLTLTVTANDTDGSVAKVEFFNGATRLGESTTAPYRYVTASLGAGTYTFTAKATDNQGSSATSGGVTVTIVEPGSSTGDLTGPDCVVANAVKTYSLNSTLLTNATAYSWWCTGSTQQITQAGSQATINFGTSFTGGQVCVGVNYSVSPWYKQFCKNVTVCTNPPVVTPPPTPQNQAPTVALTSPANSSTFTAPATINLTASASDADGSVTKVEFFNGSTKLGESSTAPYTVGWSNVGAGTYTLTAKATDNAGATTTSATISVQVKAPVVVPPPANPTSDLIGPDCVRPNDVVVFTLNARNLPNATAQSWWCGGSVQSVTPGSMGQATYNFGPYFTGGQVCVGINYSAAPWYQQFCKNVTVCPAGARVGATEIAESLVYPNPSNTHFTFVADGAIQGMTVVDQLGREAAKLGPAKAGQTIAFGDRLPAGTYLFRIQYETQKSRTIKLLKRDN